MSEAEDKAILLADVSRSTRLFRKLGDERAAEIMTAAVRNMAAIADRMGGTFIHSRGDDVLCVFDDSVAALDAAVEMLEAAPSTEVSVHAGLHFGPVVQSQGEVYGDAVNLAARLSSLSNDGEALMSARFVATLPADRQGGLRALGSLVLKGIDDPTEVYAFLLPTWHPGTHVTFTGRNRVPRHQDAAQTTTVRLIQEDRSLDLLQGEECSIGRSRECTLVLNGLWVSRRHATLTTRAGYLEYIDRSSTGSFIRMGEDSEIFVRRQSLMLVGSGVVSPGISLEDPSATPISFDVCLNAAREALSDGGD